MQTLRDTFIDR